MAKEPPTQQTSREGVISLIGPGMRVVGDCSTEGTLRIEGHIEGSARAGKAVVVGKEAVVQGDIFTQDAVIGGRVSGTVVAESRLELQASCIIEGEVRARRIKLEEGGRVNGSMKVGEDVAGSAAGTEHTRSRATPSAAAGPGPVAHRPAVERPTPQQPAAEQPVPAGGRD